MLECLIRNLTAATDSHCIQRTQITFIHSFNKHLLKTYVSRIVLGPLYISGNKTNKLSAFMKLIFVGKGAGAGQRLKITVNIIKNI